MAEPDKGSDCHYSRACTTTSLADILSTIRKRQGETFPVSVMLFCVRDGRKYVESGIIKGVLDNGDEVYIEADTFEYRRKFIENESEVTK